MVNWTIAGSILLPNVGGWLSSVTMIGQVKKPDGQAWYQKIKKPSWNPPNWVFGPTWIVLYTGMGYASYMVYRDCGGFNENSVYPLALYGTQLVFNWTWTPIFFRFHKVGLAFLHMCGLDAMAVACTATFALVNTKTLYLMTPYLLWLSFATTLNYSIWKLNPEDGDDEKIVKS